MTFDVRPKRITVEHDEDGEKYTDWEDDSVDSFKTKAAAKKAHEAAIKRIIDKWNGAPK